jgi:hypothetical protein
MMHMMINVSNPQEAPNKEQEVQTLHMKPFCDASVYQFQKEPDSVVLQLNGAHDAPYQPASEEC